MENYCFNLTKRPKVDESNNKLVILVYYIIKIVLSVS